MRISYPDAAMNEPDRPRPLSPSDLRTFALASLGGALEFYDFIIYVFFAPLIGRLFFPPGLPGWLDGVKDFGLFAAGYLARPLGGLLMAHFGDTIGRKRMFTLSVLLMAIPTLIAGLLPDFAAFDRYGIGYAAPLILLGLRMLQGAAIGGEAPGAWVFVAEHAPRGRVGFACGLLTAGLTFGILLGALVAMAMHAMCSPAELAAWGWRIPFLLGGLFGLCAMALRRRLRETPVFLAMQAEASRAERLPIGEVVARHRFGVAVSMAATLMLTGAIVVVILMTPALLQLHRHLSAPLTLRANVAACVAMTVSVVLTGRALDRFDILAVALVEGAGLIASVYALYLFADIPGALLPLCVLAGVFVGIVAVVPALMVRVFPPAVRFTGLAFSYNLAYALFGGLTPLVVSTLIVRTPLAPAHHVAIATLAGVGAIALARRRGLI